MEKATKRAHNRPPPTTAHRVELQHRQEDDDEEFTCEICIETTSIPNKKFRNGHKCAHPYCTNCVIKYIRVRLGDDNTGHIKCPAPDCDHTLDPLACAPLIGHSLFLRWCDVLCEAAIMGWDACFCPYIDCNVFILNECGGELSLSRCPQCKRWFCFRCKTVWHRRISCEESKDAVALRRLARQKRWQSCPSCGQFVELAEGCPFVRCRCGITFCYECGKRVTGHSCTCDMTTSVNDILMLVFMLLVVLVLSCFIYFFANKHI